MMAEEEKNKGKRDKIEKFIKSGGVVTDREIPIALLGITKIANSPDYEIREVHGKIKDPITLDFLNMVTHKARERWMPQLGDADGEITEKMLYEIWSQVPNFFNTIIMSEYDVKKFFERLGKKYGDRKLIYRHMKNIGTISLDGKIPTRYVNGKWGQKDIAGGFAQVTCTTDKNLPEQYESFKKAISRGKYKGKEKRIYIVTFIGDWGANMVLNILNDRVRMFPDRTYANLSKNARLLLRIIVARRNCRGRIDISQMCKLFSWKDWGNIHDQISKVEKIWAELKHKKNHFVIWTKRKGKGKNTEWTFERRGNWFFLGAGRKK